MTAPPSKPSKQVLGWTTPKIRDPHAADRWTWIVIACHTQLRLARPLAADLRRPWERPAPPGRLTPARVRRGFRRIRAMTTCPASAPKPGKPGPGRPPGSKNRHQPPATTSARTVRQARHRTSGRSRQVKRQAKSRAGRRIVGIPRAIIPALREHLSAFVANDPGALVFPGPKGVPLRRGNFNRQASWPHAARAIGAEGLHFHDLRHTGNAWAAGSGVGLRDLMARMGHDSERAAIIYQHEARGADAAITDAIDAHMESEQGKGRR